MSLDKISQVVTILAKLGVIGLLVRLIKDLPVWIEARKKAKHKEIDVIENHQRTQDEQLDLFEKGLVALLHREIYSMAVGMIKKGSVTPDDLSELDYVYKPYAKLGGNGTGKKLYQKVQKLPIREDTKYED